MSISCKECHGPIIKVQTSCHCCEGGICQGCIALKSYFCYPCKQFACTACFCHDRKSCALGQHNTVCPDWSIDVTHEKFERSIQMNDISEAYYLFDVLKHKFEEHKIHEIQNLDDGVLNEFNEWGLNDLKLEMNTMTKN
jgi:hypothetical protein